MAQAWRWPWGRLWRIAMRLFLTAILIGILPFTPIFANISVLILNTFSKITLNDAKDPTVITVLGGGLTRQHEHIVLNHYSQSRIDHAYLLHKKTGLPIITSGVESPWFYDHLNRSKNPIIASDNASMNTCENAIFTAKLLHYHEMRNSVYLVTDRYHMARARRQFARVGIDTKPYIAPLLMPLQWQSPKNNLIHSRRAVYEIVALMRDIFRPQDNCRNSDKITIEEISTPRRKPKIFSQDFTSSSH